MDPTADELIARLRRNPDDSAAFAALKAHYHRKGDFASLANLVEGWATKSRRPEEAAASFVEAAEVVARRLNDRQRAISLYERSLDRSPLQQEAWTRLGELFEQAGDDRKLVELLERRVDALSKAGADPHHIAGVHQQLGEMWEHKFKRVDRAIFHYRQAFDLDPTLVPAIYAAREIYKKAGNLKAAATLYALEANAETDTGRKIALLRELGHLRSESLGDLEGAIVALKRALGLAPGDLNVMHDLGTALLKRADQIGEGPAARDDRRRAADLLYQMAQKVPGEHAIAYCEAALDAVADYDGALELIETLAPQLNRTEMLPIRWVGYLSAAPDAPGARRRRTLLSDAYVEAGQIPDAILCLEPLLERGDAQAAERLVELYRQAGRAGDLPRALSVAIAGLPVEKRIPRLREIVEILVERGDRSGAAERAREILQIDPADPEALSFLEDDCRARGDWTELRDLLLAAARVTGLSVDARKQRLREVATISENKLADAEGAIGAWRAVTALDPADAEARRSLAQLLEENDRWDDLVQVLEREALSLTEPEAKADVYQRLADIHRNEREDLEEATQALRSLRELRPGDDDARDVLCDVLLEAGATLEAVPLLRDRIDTAVDRTERVRLLGILARNLEERLGDDEGAFDASTKLLDEEPGNLETLARMERIDLRNERYDRLLETLSYRAEVTAIEERPAIYRTMGTIADEKLRDMALAAEYYQQALDLDGNDLETLDALCDVYDRSERYRDLVVLLRERAKLEEDASARAELYRRIARIMSERVRNEEAAAETWLEVLQAGEDEEALRYLRGIAQRRKDLRDLEDYDRRLAALTHDPRERRDLLLEQAEILADELERPDDAIGVLRVIVTEIEPTYLPALGKLAQLCDEIGDLTGLADTLERQLAATEDPGLRVPLAERLADLYEGELDDRPRAIEALYSWADADLNDAEPLHRLAPLLEANRSWEQLLSVLDSLSGVEPNPGVAGELTRKAAEVAVQHMGDVDGAWARLVPRVREGDDASEQALRRLARESARGEALAELYVAMAQGDPDDRVQKRRWQDAARVYEEYLADGGRALEAALRAFALDLSDHGLLAEIDRLAEMASAWPRLAQVYDTLVRQAEHDEDKVVMLVRHADLLDRRSGDTSGALDRLMRACSIDPTDDEVLALAEELAPRAGRADELLIVYDRRKAQAEDDEQRLEAILRGAHLCNAGLRDRDRAMQYIAQGIALSVRTEELTEPVEQAVREMDDARPDLPPGAGRRALVTLYRRLAEDTEDQPAVGARLLLRAGHLLEDDLADSRLAFEVLKQAAMMDAANPDVLDELEEFCERSKALDDLDRHLAVLVQEALDSRTAAELLRRRGRLLEIELARYDEAAEVYRQLLTLTPDDAEVFQQLRSCLRRAGRHHDVLMVLDRELERVSRGRRRTRLLKEIATTWEKDLKNRWEALDAWNKVLAQAPDDDEATAAVKRLGHSTRRLSAAEVADLGEHHHARADGDFEQVFNDPRDLDDDLDDAPSDAPRGYDPELPSEEYTNPNIPMPAADEEELGVFEDETISEDDLDDMDLMRLPGIGRRTRPRAPHEGTLQLSSDQLQQSTGEIDVGDLVPVELGTGDIVAVDEASAATFPEQSEVVESRDLPFLSSPAIEPEHPSYDSAPPGPTERREKTSQLDLGSEEDHPGRDYDSFSQVQRRSLARAEDLPEHMSGIMELDSSELELEPDLGRGRYDPDLDDEPEELGPGDIHVIGTGDLEAVDPGHGASGGTGGLHELDPGELQEIAAEDLETLDPDDLQELGGDEIQELDPDDVLEAGAVDDLVTLDPDDLIEEPRPAAQSLPPPVPDPDQ